MGIELGDMWVRYKADVSDLSSKMSQAKSDMSSANDSAQSSSGGIIGAFMNAGSGVLDFGAKIGLALNGLQTLGSGAVSLGEDLLGPAAASETMQSAFTTLLGSTKAANDEMNTLDQFASKTPFKTMDIDKAGSQLIAFKTSAGDVVPELTAIGDNLSAVGRGSAANLDSVVNIFGKIRTEGKLSVGTMQELSVNGVGAWDALEKSTGKTKDQLTKMIQAGLFPANDAIKLLTSGIEKNPLYTGGMAKQSGTMTGLISTLKSNWDQMLSSFGSPILKGLEPIIGKIGDALTSPAFKGFAGGVGQGIVNVFSDIGGVVKSLSGPFGDLKDMATVTGKVLGTVFNDEPLGVFQASLSNLAGTVNGVIGPAIKGLASFIDDHLWHAIDNMHAPLQVVNGKFYDLASGIDHVSSFIKKIDFSGIATNLNSQFGPALQNIAKLLSGEFNRGLKDVGDVAKQVGGWFMTSVVPAIKQAMPGFESLGKTLLTTVIPAIINIRGVGMDFIEHVVKDFGPLFEKIIPPLIKFSGILAGDISNALIFLAPIITNVAQTVGTFADGLSDKLAPIAQKVFFWISDQINNFAHIWNTLWPGMQITLGGVWSMIQGIVQIGWNVISGIINVGLDILNGNWKQAWTDLNNAASGTLDGLHKLVDGALHTLFGIVVTIGLSIEGALTKPFNNAKDTISGIFDKIKGFVGGIGNVVGGGLASIGIHLPGHAAGIMNNPVGHWAMVGENGPEPMYVPKGASIFPSGSGSFPSGVSGGSGEIHVHNHIYLDGREITETVSKHQLADVRSQGGLRR